MRLLLPIIIVLCLLSQGADAQLIMRQNARKSELPPKALIILLPYSVNRIQKLKEMGKAELAERLRDDLTAVRAIMVEDYNSYFSYCPYYFAADSNSDLLGDREYAGILLDSALRPVANPVIGRNDSTQMIAYFGYRSRDAGHIVHTISETYMEMFNGDSDVLIQQMVFLDYRMRQLNRPLPRTPGGFFPKYLLKKPRYEYRYVSNVFDVQYRLTAPFVSAGLKNFYGEYPYRIAP